MQIIASLQEQFMKTIALVAFMYLAIVSPDSGGADSYGMDAYNEVSNGAVSQNRLVLATPPTMNAHPKSVLPATTVSQIRRLKYEVLAQFFRDLSPHVSRTSRERVFAKSCGGALSRPRPVEARIHRTEPSVKSWLPPSGILECIIGPFADWATATIARG